MANRFLGETTVEVGDVPYTLRCDFNAMCEFEDATGQDAIETFEAFEAGRISARTMRAMMWAFLRRHHPDATMQEAGDILSDNPEILMQVIQAASPDEDEAAEMGNGKSRGKPKAKPRVV